MNHFSNLAAFNVWANKRMCDFIIANLRSEQIDKELVSSFPSVQKTIYHIRDAEATWLERLGGIPIKGTTGSFETELNIFIRNSKALLEFLSSRDEKYLNGIISYVHKNGVEYAEQASDIVTHVINHSTFHRGQLIMMFRQLGFTEGIPKTDFIAYAREIAAVKAP